MYSGAFLFNRKKVDLQHRYSIPLNPDQLTLSQLPSEFGVNYATRTNHSKS